MYQTHKTYIRPEMKMADLINENYTLLLFLEHMEIDFTVSDKTVSDLCEENDISLSMFIIISNLYNGFYPDKIEITSVKDIPTIIKFLKNSHRFYTNDKYPEIKRHLAALHEKHNTDDIALIEKFFNVYFEEVLEHLNYEEETAFPYFCQLISEEPLHLNTDFSVNNYKEQHSDIETKLADLKNLLLKHIVIENDLTLRRQFLYSLFELEFDLEIHSTVEEIILLPLINQVEMNRLNG
ncbi:MAG: hemerythrin domain-containing protein [Bacteroidales bacterium]